MFTGWIRHRRQPWRPVVQANSEDAALALLLNEPPGDKILLPTGSDPNCEPERAKAVSTHTLTVDGWHPARLNQLLAHWAVRARLKRADREMVALHARLAGVPPATGKRRVSLVLTLGPRQRGGDPDAYWKSVLDALVHAGLLLDDNRQGVELGRVAFRRGEIKATRIVLEDVEDGRRGVHALNYPNKPSRTTEVITL